MNTDVSDLLNESIDRLTDGAQVPPGMADRALRRNRQRQMTLGAASATGAAVLATAAVLVATAATGAAPRRNGIPPAQTTASVVSRIERALTVAQRKNLIEEIHTVGHHYGLDLAQVNIFHLKDGTVRVIRQAGPTAAQEMIWSYRGQLREQGLDAAGRPVFDARSTTVRSLAGPKSVLMKVSGVGVDYRAKTWWRSAVRLTLPTSATPPACKNAYLPPPVGSTVNWPAEIHAALSCGHYRTAGHQQIGTARVIKLVSVKPNGPYSETLWVNPATYLPLRLAWHWLDHRGEGPGTLTGDFRWLRPTAANLATLRVTVPHGFQRDRTGGLPVPGMAF